MKLVPILSLVLLAVARPPGPVALVYSLTGTATVADRPLHRLDRLPAGATVQVGPASHLALAFASGVRYELGEGARVTIGKTDLAARAGLVKALPRVPPDLILAAISKEDRPGARAGAVRIRAGEEIDCVSPRDGAATLAAATVLRFRPADGASRHEVAVEDSQGNVVFETVTESPSVSVPPGTLKPGARYRWTVKALDKPGPVIRGGADFVTLSLEAAAARERLKEAVRGEENGQELLDEVDRALGMEEPSAERLRTEAGLLERRGDWDGAVALLQRALELDRRSGSPSLSEAKTINNLGVTAAKRGDYASAESFLKQALEIREALAPETAEITGSLNNLANVARHRGDLDAAEAYLSRAEQLQSRLAPESGDHALILQNLGNLATERGDLDMAESSFRRALALFEKTEPLGDGVSDCLRNLGNVAMVRGDLASAEALFRHSLAVPGPEQVDELSFSLIWIDLGNIAARRGDLDEAEGYLRKALAIQEQLAPNGWEATASLTNLGRILARKGDRAAARTFLRRSLEIEEMLSPDRLASAETLADLARLEMEGGDLAVSEELLRQALAVLEKQAPESLGVVEVLRHLGELDARRGRFQDAVTLHRRALDLQRRVAPETTGEAEALHALGLAERLGGRRDEAARDLCRAADVLDLQRPRIGGTQEAKASFEASFGDYYQACLEGLVDLGRPAEAFHVLERSRARSFLALLSERDLHLPGLSPELDRERRRAYADYDRVQAQLADLSAGRDDAEIERLTGELRDLRSRQEAIAARIRRESPRSAAIEYPDLLDLAGARAALDPGTVLLEYAVGEEATWLFVVQSGLSVHRIPVGAKTLRAEVERFLRLVEHPGSDRADLQVRGRRLYDLLVRPAERQIAQARRVLVSPDGPLHTLPFAALQRHGRYLVEWKPLHTVLSTTVYAELRARPVRRESGEGRLAAFGDPIYPPAATDPEVREAVERGLALDPLPASRAELEAIASLYPGAALYLGRDATEERAKSLGPGDRFVHFACHGLIDERFPLNSALALTLPESAEEGRNNGLLQAWEIFEQVRLDADLVTLSACDTGLGKEMGGEGLVGLVRAFQYAGARSVLASSWSVSDASTADLMKRFYGHLRQGKSKDEALRLAQMDLLRGKAFAHPYYWAAFQLTGDWR
ncbi:MAG: CHAT domain-containing protein [Acidobacteriota bacterium]